MTRDLLDPLVQDTLPLLGVGLSAQVRRAGRYAVKIAHPVPELRARLLAEAEVFRRLSARPSSSRRHASTALFVPRLHAVSDDGRALVRGYLPHPRLSDLLNSGEMDPRWAAPFVAALDAARAERAATGFVIDFSPANLYWDAARGRFWLADLGERLEPSLFDEVHAPADVEGALSAYRRWRAARFGRDHVERAALPPSGRFHVETAVGEDPEARLLWRNRHALARLGVPLDARALLRLTNHVTWAPPRGHLPSTRYQDSPGLGDGHAKGDGRAVVVGELPAAGLSLMAKGCGPTALAWIGNAYHEDGLVSFPRTLWETAVADELARLGFSTPEVLAVVSASKTTVDNTDREWPAAVALRASRTIYRLGHLTHHDGDPAAFRAILDEVGRRTFRRDFSSKRPAHLSAFVLRFARNLGLDVGRTDALNIHGFNATLGNVLVDGHFIDFSTVRFLRYFLPDFRYMNDTQTIRAHRVAFRHHPRVLVDALRRGEVLDEEAAARLKARALAAYDRAVHEGTARGFMRYLGLDEDAASRLTPPLRERLYTALRRLRLHRAETTLAFDFWKQEVKAPLFDVEGRLADVVGAPTYVEDERATAMLASSFAKELSPRARRDAAAFLDVLRRVLRRLPAVHAPRRWDEIVRPFMAAERLADLCYRRSTPERFGAFTRLLASSGALPEGRWDAAAARARAAALGHVELAPLGSGAPTTVIGLLPELAEALLALFGDLLGEAFLGALVHGPRVSAASSDPIVEHGARLRTTTPLGVVVLTREGAHIDDALEQALAAATARLGALLPLELLVVPARRSDDDASPRRGPSSFRAAAWAFVDASGGDPDGFRVLGVAGQTPGFRAG